MNGLVNEIDRARTLIRLKRFEECESTLMEIIARCRQREAPMHEGIATQTLGELYLEQGRLDEALTALRSAYNTFRGTIPLVEASVGVGLAVALARANQLDELDDLTLGTEQYVENFPEDLLYHIRIIAEVRLAQNEPAAAYRHIGRARKVAKQIEGGGNPRTLADLDMLEKRIVGT
jgi:tetratricopeptide (TPR) repeat protein